MWTPVSEMLHYTKLVTDLATPAAFFVVGRIVDDEVAENAMFTE